MLGRKAVSDIIAAMLMILIVIAAGIILYAYAAGLLGSLQAANVPKPYGVRLALEYYDWSGTMLNLTLRNVGVANAVLDEFFIEGQLVSASFDSDCVGGSLTVQAPCKVSLTGYGAVTAGLAYTVKIVTADGTVSTFSCIAGRTG